ncbi:MAG: glycoside hydrolase family 3 C-terminal domain-containing protein [Terracidiphilus sp.]|nr:glycoside hydrolase family 3 C-terminal domain-containing protein [Terracidiphilus sp.]MDR3776178.1 glycoside hydrolase family 3 C-terminal domain-containing protein [Terracidiphilus sp.]
MKSASVHTEIWSNSVSAKSKSLVFRSMSYVLLGISVLLTPMAGQQPAPENARPKTVDARIESLLHQMTLEEKVRMLFGGEQPGVSQLPGVPRLGIPAILASDGPRGMSAAEGTAFPSGIGLASSWDPSLFQAVGTVIGQESRAAGRTMVFAPALNIERDPLNGRFFEYLTEDPFLDGQLAASMVHGIQGERVAACIKHFAANNREWNRDWYMSNVDERTLEEIYLPGFKAAVEQGRAWAVMTAANGVNGQLACQNHSLLTTTLKDKWGFDGLVLTDYNHARGTEKAALAGLDVSMPWADWNTESFGKPLLDDVTAGKIPLSLIDDKVRRILRVMQRVGLLDGIDPHTGGSVDTPEHQTAALRAAEESLVLLKNDAHILPLSAKSLKHIIVLGPNANRLLCDGGFGGSSGVRPPYEVTVLEGLKKRLGADRAEYLSIDEGGEFEAIDLRFLKTKSGKPGVDAKYFNDGLETPVLERTESSIDANWEMRSPDPAVVHSDNFGAQYETVLTPPKSGYYTIRLSGQNSATLDLNGQPFLTNNAPGGFHSTSLDIYLDAGVAYPLRVSYHAEVGDAALHLEWSLPRTPQQLDAKIREAAPKLRSADAVIFVGGWNHGLDTEGLDRQNMDFPKGQEELIRRVASVNPHTVVVLMHGSPFTVSGWIDSVPAVLDAWYPGMEGGNAIAEALVGDINPAGKLTFSWPKQLKDSPTYSIGTADKDNVNYKEGIFVGYRYFDTRDIAPQFPFGFGLNYSDFTYSGLTAVRSPQGFHVSLSVKNVSARSGAQVVQLYIAPTESTAPRPVHELRGFRRLTLKPGEMGQVSFDLDASSFRHWDTEAHAWRNDPGDYIVQVGDSSRDLPLQAHVIVPISKDEDGMRATTAGARDESNEKP